MFLFPFPLLRNVNRCFKPHFHVDFRTIPLMPSMHLLNNIYQHQISMFIQRNAILIGYAFECSKYKTKTKMKTKKSISADALLKYIDFFHSLSDFFFNCHLRQFNWQEVSFLIGIYLLQNLSKVRPVFFSLL